MSANCQAQAPPNRGNLHPKIRSSILKILSKKLSTPSATVIYTIEEDIAVNAIILEYLEWIGFQHTVEMFRRETKTPLPRLTSEGKCLSNIVKEKLKPSVMDDELPVIFSLIFKIKNVKSPLETDKSLF